MAEAGIGVDIVEIARMERIMRDTPASSRACSPKKNDSIVRPVQGRQHTTPAGLPRVRPF